ncbi:hypothetical protein BBO99_00009487 [Phytophthora kernoviae]|uniref:Pre-mRNA-splicing factor 38 n=2 Tax=Phytophthora kernoviae TaxID=325452 RepID=A0A3R7G8Q9_9STRA|nr:hypothetical protein G195_011437 [Phytophthora kernoviae 00238/432]RLN45195.1 hypothetical protein BBI17_009632 [Phytophthora kernoviae]RLN73245.1 hypothetical protein BBO99_00009487 [Phytophthora kernoviae]
MNSTDPSAQSVHGVNPQTLIEKIMRNRIYASIYWKEQCFGLTAETLVDKAVELQEFGGTFGVYLRLVGKPIDVYTLLEPLLSDYRKIRKRNVIGWEITHVDEIADALLNDEYYIDLALPRLMDRELLEKNEGLPPRRSVLEDELDAASDSSDSSSGNDEDKAE